MREKCIHAKKRKLLLLKSEWENLILIQILIENGNKHGDRNELKLWYENL